jgi:hypothetical protein
MHSMIILNPNEWITNSGMDVRYLSNRDIFRSVVFLDAPWPTPYTDPLQVLWGQTEFPSLLQANWLLWLMPIYRRIKLRCCWEKGDYPSMAGINSIQHSLIICLPWFQSVGSLSNWSLFLGSWHSTWHRLKVKIGSWMKVLSPVGNKEIKTKNNHEVFDTLGQGRGRLPWIHWRTMWSRARRLSARKSVGGSKDEIWAGKQPSFGKAKKFA